VKARLTLALATVATVAACGSTIVTQQPVAVISGTSSLSTSAGDWAILPMGGAGAFWEVLNRAATGWRLVTPPAVASTGGFVAAPSAGGLTVGFLPSVSLTFTPLATSGNAGKTWTTGLIDSALADEPDALATGSGGQMLALLRNGSVLTGSAAKTWSVLAKARAIASSAAGRRCGLTALTAVSFGPEPLVAGACAKASVVGVFGWRGGQWQAVGPAVPAPLTGKPVRVLRMTASATLLQAGTRTAILWPGHVAEITQGQPIATGFGPGGAAWMLLPDRRAMVTDGPGDPWRSLPAVPAGTAVLAAGPSGWQALAVSGTRVTIWQQPWHPVQHINVPIP
jgi:hypothetical protein